jgi:hypothetical protein
VNLYIMTFLLIGASFGLVSFPNRHLFSEGPSRSEAAVGTQWSARLFWAAVCTFLWPIMLLTGFHSAWILAKRKRAALVAGANGPTAR